MWMCQTLKKYSLESLRKIDKFYETTDLPHSSLADGVVHVAPNSSSGFLRPTRIRFSPRSSSFNATKMLPKTPPRPGAGGHCRLKLALALAAVVLIAVAAEAAPYNDEYSKEQTSYKHKASYGGDSYDYGHDEPYYGYDAHKTAEYKPRYVEELHVSQSRFTHTCVKYVIG